MFVSLPTDDASWSILLQVNIIYLFLALLALWLLIYIVHAISYYIILGKDGKKINFFSMLKICISGFALNDVTPAGLVGGEPYRIMELKRFCPIEKASSSTLTFSLFYVIGHLLAWVASVIVYLALGCPGDTYTTILLCVAGFVCFAVTIVFYFSKRKGLVYPFMSLLAKIPFIKKPIKKLNDKNATRFTEIDNNIKEFRTKKRFWAVLGLQFLSRMLEAMEYLLIFFYLGQSVTPIEAILIFGTASLIANIVFLIPMQAGTREVGLLMGLSFVGLGSFLAPASIIYRVRTLFCIGLGVILVIIAKKNKEKQHLEATNNALQEEGQRQIDATPSFADKNATMEE